MNQLWRAFRQPADTQFISDTLLPLLSVTEIARLKKFKHVALRDQYLFSRALIRTALSHHYQLPFSHWVLSEKEKAAPCVDNLPQAPLKISLSHSKDCVLVGISEHALGVDVEKIAIRDNLSAIAKKVYTPAQQKELDGLDVEAAKLRFYELWTQKEARYKAIEEADQRGAMISTAPWPLCGHSVENYYFDGYCAAVVAKKNVQRFKHFEANPFGEIKPLKFT